MIFSPVLRAALAGILLSCGGVAAADESLVRNGNLALPEGEGPDADSWELALPGAGQRVQSPDGEKALELTAEEGQDNATWMQRDLPVAPGGRYRLTYRAKAKPGQAYRGYVEWWDGSHTNAYAYGSDWQTGTGEWQEHSTVFTYPEGMSLPYIALNVHAPGQALFAQIAVEDLEAGDARKTSAAVALDRWQLSPNAKKVADREGDTIELRSDRAEDPASARLGQVVLTPGKRYRLSYEVKSDPGTVSSTGFQHFRVYREGSAGEPLDGGEWQDCFESWQMRQLDFDVAGDQDGSVSLVAELKAPGMLLIRNFSLEEIAAEEKAVFKVAFTSPAYRQILFGDEEAIAGNIALLSDEVAQLQVALEQDGKERDHQELTVAKDRTPQTFTFPGDAMTWGEAFLVVRARDAAGAELSTERISLLKVKNSSPSVVVDNDLVLRDNGRPFFPIVSWSLPNNHRQMHDLHQAGFNTIVAPPRQALLDTAAQYQMKVVGDLEQIALVARESDPAVLRELEPKLRAMVDRYKTHPALLTWYIADEPLWTGRSLPPLLWTYAQLRKLDPYHPIWINEAPRNSVEALSRYARASDIFGVDIYPVPQGGSHSELEDRSLSSVGKYADRFRETVADQKPIWMVLQGFAWLNLHDPKADGIYPTWEETRFMAYNSLVHGARGIVYWGTQLINDPTFWDALMRTTRELADLSAVLVEPSVPGHPGLKTENPAVGLLQKRHQGEDYFIAINESDQPLDVEFAAASGLAQLHVQFENRTLKAAGGKFRDQFKPWAVHVYSTSETLPPPLIPTLKDLPNDGESYQEEAIRRKAHQPFQSSASWVWSGENVSKSKAYFRRAFSVRPGLRKAVLWVTGDDYYRAFLNGKQVGVDLGSGPFPEDRGGWMTIEGYDVTKNLQEGQNLLAIEAEDAGRPPAGLLADLRLEYGDETTETIVSDASWKGNSAEQSGWKTITFDDRSWHAPEVIAKYGSGPWLDGLQPVVVTQP